METIQIMVFRDQQFCTSSKCSEFGTCWRSFTPEVEESAEKWWKGFDLAGSAPIDKRSYADEDCYNPKLDK